MKVFVINREQDAVRRAAIEAQLRALEIPYEIVRAVDGRALDEREKRALADYPKMRRVLRVLSDGEIGCAASHQKIYRKMLAEGMAEAVVVEDDARIAVDGGRFRQEASLSQGDAAPRVKLLADRKYGRVLTVGYAINRAGAEAMLAYNTPIWRVADCWESLYRRGRLQVDWSGVPLVEPDRALGSVITPQGVPPHRTGLPRDVRSLVCRALWRFYYGVGLRI